MFLLPSFGQSTRDLCFQYTFLSSSILSIYSPVLLISFTFLYCSKLYFIYESLFFKSFNFSFLPSNSFLLHIYNWAIELLIVFLKILTGFLALQLPYFIHSFLLCIYTFHIGPTYSHNEFLSKISFYTSQSYSSHAYLT